MIKKLKSVSSSSLVLLSVAIGTWQTGVAAQQDKTGLVPEDYFDFVYMNSPRISPNNDAILFVKQTVNEDASGRDNQIYKINKHGVVSEFTQGKSDWSPKWSKDGRQVAFIRAVDGVSQIFVMHTDGGEAKQITSLSHDLSSFEWFPSGDKLLLSLNVSNAEMTEDKNADEQKTCRKRAEPDTVVVKNAKYISNGSGYLSDERTHLFEYDIKTQSLNQLTSGTSWNAQGPVISDNGAYIYYHANKTGRAYEGNENSDIYRLELASKNVTQITHHPHSQYSTALAPNSEALVYLHSEDTYEQTDLMLLAGKGKKPFNLTKNFDRNATPAIWSADNKHLYFTANDHGAKRLFSVAVKSGKVTKLLDKNQKIDNLTASQDGRFLVFTAESSTELPELYRLDLNNNKLSKLTTFNDKLRTEKAVSAAQDVWFINDKGMRVQGFVHKPLNFDKNKSYPVILNIKGGPGGMWGHQWFFENQMYAAQGYAVVYVNYRGSGGYGIKHSQAVRKDYGGADYQDNIQFLDNILAKNTWMDKDKLFITGGSHGGFLTNWITTKTDRFKAAVTQRSVSSWVSEAGTQEYTPSQMTKEFGGHLWNNFDAYWDRSPLKYANKVSTPTLIIHSDADMITPIGQGQEWFYALKVNEVPVEMVVFKGETHSLSRTGKPTNLVARIEHILDWFERYNQ
ncbi:S9 family peptidase [Pseudoalteromonas umbrosa]|uniref:S9 family peptidase n=1 Tax=Pseudoalteromonas umbrosa TaxID=3048489 RepID=UPI0024C24CE4|nr:S9 family peptidase [Pseudoalteromonas sp. B95]MDK1287932.1 S9 family peptidase [Pseudoalteromonas sp. B95]